MSAVTLKWRGCQQRFVQRCLLCDKNKLGRHIMRTVKCCSLLVIETFKSVKISDITIGIAMKSTQRKWMKTLSLKMIQLKLFLTGTSYTWYCRIRKITFFPSQKSLFLHQSADVLFTVYSSHCTATDKLTKEISVTQVFVLD